MSDVTFTTVKNERFHEDVGRQLARSIVRGELEPGTVLPSEAMLIEQFKVSRSVVREAVRNLAQRGMVKIWQGRRTTIRPQEEWNLLDPLVLTTFREAGRIRPLIEDFLWIRRHLEPQIAAESALAVDQQLLADLEEILVGMEGLLAEPQAFFEQDMSFHYRLAAATGNRVLKRLMVVIGDLFNVSRDLTHELASAPAGALAWHRRIFEAIAAGDPDGAHEAMAGHLEWTTDRMLRSH